MLVFLFLLTPFVNISAKIDEASAPASDVEVVVPDSSAVDLETADQAGPIEADAEKVKDEDNTENIDKTKEEKTDDSADTLGFSASALEEEDPTIIPQSTTKQLLPGTEKSSGSLIYDYPIVVPPGRNGLQPDLKLSYNNQGIEEGSIFGAGWNLSIPYIERINRKGSDKLYSENYFNSSLSGELLPMSGNEWGAKVDNGEFLKYEFIDNVWTFTDKEGTTYKFGLTSASRQDDPNDSARIYKWMLQEIRDTNNNYIRYEYFKDAGQVYPSRIVYTGNGVTDGIFEVNFLREIRNDVSKSYKTAFSVITNYRVYEIQTKISNSWARKYTMTYTNADNGRRAILNTIVETAKDESDNIITLPATDFDYVITSSGASWISDAVWNNYPVRFSECIISDINGDGLADLMQSYKDRNGVEHKNTYINNGDGSWTIDINYQSPVIFYQDVGLTNLRDRGVRGADVNGDGLTDLIEANSFSNQIWLNNGNGWTLITAWHSPLLFANGNGGVDPGDSAQITDLNGDGLPDIFRAYTNIDFSYDVFINTGNGWVRDISLVMPVDISHGVMISDINGDNLVDFVQAYCSGPGCLPIRTAYSNIGNGWVQDNNWAPPSDILFTGNYSSYDEGTRLIDYNADGLPDIIKALDNHGVYSINYTNQGNGWILGGSIWNTGIPFGTTSNTQDTGARIVDIDGDGMQDIIQSYIYGGIQDLYKSTNINTKNQADFLSRIIYSKGGYTDFTYKSTSEYKNGATLLNADMSMIVNVVDTINTNDGLGNSFSTHYQYEGGQYYYGGPYDRKFSGFSKVIATDDAGNKTISYYHQGNDTNSSQGEFEDHISKAGKIYRTETTDSSGNIYSKTISKWDRADLGNGRSFVKQVQQIDATYDGDSSHMDSAEEYAFDNSTGNLTQKIERGEVTASDNGTFTNNFEGEDRITTYNYVTNTEAHILGLPSEVVISDYLGDYIKEDKYYYDGEDLGYATKGNQVSHEAWAWWEGGYINEQKAYDATYGLVTATKDFKDNWTNYAYDTYNLYPATITNPLDQTESYLYDYSSGKVKQKTDANGRIFQNVYDGLDRLLTEKQPDLTTPTTLVTKTAYVYTDTSGAVNVRKTDYLSSTASINSYTYFDGLGRKIQERKQAETSYEVKDFAYNNLDLLLKESLLYFSSGTARTSATTNTALYINYVYDPMYRLIQTTDAVGTVTNDYDDWKLTVTDKKGISKNIYKDCYGRISAVDEILGGNYYTTYYEYDGLNNLTRITDALGNIRNFGYNPLGRRTMAEDLHSPDDETFSIWWYEYDENGNLFARYDPNNQVVLYTYDALGRTLTEDYEGQEGIEVTYAYDSGTNGIGRLTSITTPTYTETIAYNPLGGVALETKTISGTAFTTSYTYDRQGNQLTITNPDNSIIKYEYGAGGLLNKVSRKESTASTYSYVVSNFDYSPMEQLTITSYANGMTTTNTYNAAKLYRLSTKVTTIAGSVKGQSITYTYDNNGNITRLVDNSATSSKKTVNYVYDDLNRLLSATATGVATGQTAYTENYTYDIIGNLTSKTGQGAYVYAGNQGDSYANPHAVTSIGSTAFTYDHNGNLLAKGATLTNTWDYSNRLITSTVNSVTSTYTYDPSGQRLTVSNGTVTTKYPTKSYNTDGTSPTKHIFAGGLEIGTITGTGTSAVIHYTATDHLTGSNLTTNSSDIKEELLDYLPFGTIRIDEKSGTYSDQRKFAGHEFDQDTGLSYMNARYYDGAMGRFISQDPAFLAVGDSNQIEQITGQKLNSILTDPQSLNSYAYARNNPLINVDPDGQSWEYADKVWNGLCNNVEKAWNDFTTNSSLSSPPVGSPEYRQKMSEGLSNGGIYLGTNSKGKDVYAYAGPGALKNVANTIKAGASVAGLKVTNHAAEQFAERNMNIAQIENAFQNGTKYLDTRTGNLLHIIGERGKGGYTIVTDRAQKVLVSTENFVTNLVPKNSPNRYKLLK